MKSVPATPNSERVYSLDALRSVMMLLGIVLHTALTYGSGDYKDTWPLKDPDNSVWFHLMAGLIHAFRMPTFFAVSGYFSALLFDRKGANAMLNNRVQRLLLPFVAAVLVCYPLVVFFFSFSFHAFAGATSPFHSAIASVRFETFLPQRVFHLWFLYYLILFVFVTWLMATTIKKDSFLATVFTAFSGRILKHVVLRTTIVSFLFFGCLCWMGNPGLKTSMGWQIQPDIFVTYFIFFGVGWLIYQTRALAKMAAYPIAQLTGAFIVFALVVFIPWPTASWTPIVQAGMAAVCGTLFVFGFIAFFQRYFNHYSPVLTYLMEASYWVYIIHLPIVLFIPGLLASSSLPALVKFSITILSTTVLALLSYHYLVRGTFVGLFLHGKVHKKDVDTLTVAEVLRNGVVNPIA